MLINLTKGINFLHLRATAIVKAKYFLRDVKTKDNSSTLIDFVAARMMHAHGRAASTHGGSSIPESGGTAAVSLLPSSAVMARAAETNFDEVMADMKRLELETLPGHGDSLNSQCRCQICLECQYRVSI